MPYAEIKPHPALLPYIDCYWRAVSTPKRIHTTRVLPDGCIDMILNVFDDRRSPSGIVNMKSETAYLIGTMTTFKEDAVMGESTVLGIRFKPGAFAFFYPFSSLHELTDNHVELDKSLSPDIQKTRRFFSSYLDRFFLAKLSQPKHALLSVIADIESCKGQVKVSELAARNHITCKQLERHFRYQVGISPKEFISIKRYQSAYQLITSNISNQTLLQIAVETGYHDQAHLSHEIKKYTGLPPSLL